jgi:hypothetical protein
MSRIAAGGRRAGVDLHADDLPAAQLAEDVASNLPCSSRR